MSSETKVPNGNSNSKKGFFAMISSCLNFKKQPNALEPSNDDQPTQSKVTYVDTPETIVEAKPVNNKLPIPVYNSAPFLGSQITRHEKRKTLVLDLDETLVHSTFKLKSDPADHADYIFDLPVDEYVYTIYVNKRPYVDEFLSEMAKYFEIVIFTASMAQYADPVLDKLDVDKEIVARLFRSHCTHHGDAFVKDLTKLGRKVEEVVIIDNSPYSYMFQPQNAIPVTSWFSDKSDTELKDLTPFLIWLSKVKTPVDQAIHDAVFGEVEAPPATPHLQDSVKRQSHINHRPLMRSPLSTLTAQTNNMSVSPIYQVAESSESEEFYF